MPTERDGFRKVVANVDPVPWQHVWLWGTGLQPLEGDILTFVRDSNPLRWAQLVATAADFSSTGTLAATVKPQQNEAQ